MLNKKGSGSLVIRVNRNNKPQTENSVKIQWLPENSKLIFIPSKPRFRKDKATRLTKKRSIDSSYYLG
jgi:hypothetical protein